MNVSEKVRENRLRRALDRQGYRLLKSRARDPRSLTYGGYQITDLRQGVVVAGWGNADRGYAFDLDDVERWVRKDDKLQIRDFT
jgi:hypothetical protein